MPINLVENPFPLLHNYLESILLASSNRCQFIETALAQSIIKYFIDCRDKIMDIGFNYAARTAHFQ